MTHILRIPVVLFLALYLLPCGLLSREPQQADSTIVVLLGTGMPRPNPEASGPATAIIVGEQVFLFDAGPGVERQLSAAHL
ncbi:MAG TPA: MBL fold metallo-hydrolase, partial [Bacteroidetes bacterium]|nr:MBL fold metallo-hydrolase [Bacteroidota bacterium]